MTVLLLSLDKIQKQLTENLRNRRLASNLTQKALSERSGVPLPTVRKFEQQGQISLESLLKLLMVLGGIDAILQATQPQPAEFSSIDDVLNADRTPVRKRGRRK
jgi:transcriptional regulator with XRE-family HTH domain